MTSAGIRPTSLQGSELDDFPFRQQPGHLVRRLHQIGTALFLEQCGSLSVTPIQYATLEAIERNPGCDQRTIARFVAIDRTTINLVSQKLEERQWIVRNRIARQITLMLTGSGQMALVDLRVMLRKHDDLLLGPLDVADRAVFMSLLNQLVSGNNTLSRVPVP